MKRFLAKARDLQVQLHSLTNQHAQQQARIEAQAAEVQASSAELGRQQGNLERIRTLLRLENATAGRIDFEGSDVTRLDGDALKSYRRKIQRASEPSSGRS